MPAMQRFAAILAADVSLLPPVWARGGDGARH
jgi:hypothetical protein